jgi:hypothetical protein
MALARYEGVAQDSAGNVIPNATVEVRRDAPGRPVVPLFGDRNGTVPLGNPIKTDALGKFAFHAPGGVYYVRVFTGPSQAPFQEYVRRYQALGTAAERDVEDLARVLESGTAGFSTIEELQAFVPTTTEGVLGKVLRGAGAGFYHYDDTQEEGEKWIKDRPLYDTFARLSVVDGTANAIEAELEDGIDDATVKLMALIPEETNTGAVTLNGLPLKDVSGAALIAGQLVAGRSYNLTDEGDHYRLRQESDVTGVPSGIAAAAAVAVGQISPLVEQAEAARDIAVPAKDAAVAAKDQSVAAKTAAELARDASMVNSLTYADEATGRAAVSDGQTFDVRPASADSREASRRFLRSSSSVSGLVTRFPSLTAVEQVTQADSARRQMPNAFTDEELDFTDFMRVSTSTLRPARVRKNGQICGSITAAAGSSASLTYTINVADIEGIDPANRHVSASILIESIDAGVGGGGQVRVLHRQKDASGNVIGAKTVTHVLMTSAGLSVPLVDEFPNVELDATCTAIDVYIDISASGSSAARTMWFRRMNLVAGPDPVFRAPRSVGQSDQDKAVEEAWGLETQQPNLFSVGELDFTDTSRLTAVTNPVVVGSHDGVPCYEVTTLEGGTTAAARWAIPRSVFSGSKMTGSIRVLYATPVDAGSIVGAIAYLYVQQFNVAGGGSGAEIANTRYQKTLCGREGITKARTFRIPTIDIHADCVEVRYFVAIAVAGGAPDRVVKFRDMMLASGANPFFRRPPMIGAAGLGTLYISPNGSNVAGTGSIGNPLATPDAAAARFYGVGDIVMLPGDFPDGMQLSRSLIKQMEVHTMTDSSGTRAKVRYGTKLTGITKTGSRTKIYQATIPIPSGQPNWICQDGVNDLSTAIVSGRSWPLYRGRGYRLPFARLFKTTATTLSAALDEMDAASGPKCFYDASTTTMYFTIQGGGDGTAASIYVPSDPADFNKGFISNAPNFWSGQQGKLKVYGLEIYYGNMNFRPFRHWHGEDIKVFGASANGFDVAFWGGLRGCEGAGNGAGNTANGDGANAQNFAEWWHENCLFHDNNDDGESSHTRCQVEGSNGVVEFNGGNGLIPALGGWARYTNMQTNFNAVQAWGGSTKYGGIGAIGDGTVCIAERCRSEGDKIGFFDGGATTSARLEARNSVAKNSTTYGFDCTLAVDSRYVGTGTAKSTRTVVESSVAL